MLKGSQQFLLMSSFYRWGNWASEILNDMCGRSGVRTKSDSSASILFSPTSYLPSKNQTWGQKNRSLITKNEHNSSFLRILALWIVTLQFLSSRQSQCSHTLETGLVFFLTVEVLVCQFWAQASKCLVDFHFLSWNSTKVKWISPGYSAGGWETPWRRAEDPNWLQTYEISQSWSRRAEWLSQPRGLSTIINV